MSGGGGNADGTGNGGASASLLAFVAEVDARCPACAYSLAGLTADVCPECGVGLRLGLSRASRSWGWVFGLVGLAVVELLLVLALGSLVVMVVVEEWHRFWEAALFGGLLALAVAAQSAALTRWIVRPEAATPARAILAWLVGFGIGGAVWLVAAVIGAL